MDNGLRYLIYEAWRQWRKGSPFTVDLFMDLNERGISPERLSQIFDGGFVPPFDDEFMAVVSPDETAPVGEMVDWLVEGEFILPEEFNTILATINQNNHDKETEEKENE